MSAACADCAGTGQAAHVQGSPCPYCRPAAAREWAAAQPLDYDPREDADSELVGNPAEEDESVWDGRSLPMTDVAAVLALETMGDEALDWLTAWSTNERLRELVDAERNTRAVERAAAEAQRYLDANEGGWALPNQETPE